MEINKDFVLTLKKDPQTNKLQLVHIAIENPLTEEITNLKTTYKKLDKQGAEIYDDIQKGYLKDVLTGWNYAYYMSSPEGYLEPDPIKIKSFLTETIRTNETVLAQIEKYVTAGNLNRQLNKIKEDPEILAYSHQYLGWTYMTNKLNANFTLLHRTNFGYGLASHFYTILTYRDISLVSFSDWIVYRFVERSELIRYSAKHSLTTDGWKHAMEYAATAWNQMVSNETEFVNRYIVRDCEQMVKALEDFLTKTSFNFIEGNHGYKGLPQFKPELKTYYGPALDLIRAEKIAGALTLIDKIKELEQITNVAGYIKRIEDCNRKTLSKLPRVVADLENAISTHQAQMEYLEKVMEEKLIKSHHRNDLFNTFYSALTTDEKNDSKLYESKFNALHPCVKTAYEDWLQSRLKFESKRSEMITEENILRKLFMFKNEIAEYFERKNS